MQHISIKKLEANQYSTILHLGVLILTIFICVLVLADIRVNVLGEPFGGHLRAISIAISYLVYDVKGLIGLDQVLFLLNEQIPYINYIDKNL